MNIDFQTTAPQALAANASLDDLSAAIAKLSAWDERSATVLDFIYRTRLVNALLARRGEADLLALSRHLARVTNPLQQTGLSQLSQNYVARWQAYRDLLEGRIAGLNTQSVDDVLARTHVREILQALASGQIATQEQLRQRFKLQKANATRILNLMETAGLIIRERHGKENHLRLGVEAPEAVSQPTATPGQHAGRRGISYLLAA